MKRQETNKLKGGEKRLCVDKNAQTRAAGFPRLKETRTRTEAAAEPAVSFHSEQINPMSAGGDACRSREKTDSSEQRDTAGEDQLYRESCTPALLKETQPGSAPGAGTGTRLRLAPPSAEEAFFFC